jgi:hypothetical protein
MASNVGVESPNANGDFFPVLRHQRNGDVTLASTVIAARVKARSNTPALTSQPMDLQQQMAQARQNCAKYGANINNRRHLLSQVTIQFGQYYGRTFWWLLSNDVGYSINLLASHVVSVVLLL